MLAAIGRTLGTDVMAYDPRRACPWSCGLNFRDSLNPEASLRED